MGHKSINWLYKLHEKKSIPPLQLNIMVPRHTLMSFLFVAVGSPRPQHSTDYIDHYCLSNVITDYTQLMAAVVIYFRVHQIHDHRYINVSSHLLDLKKTCTKGIPIFDLLLDQNPEQEYD
jgi:hypothetical protein